MWPLKSKAERVKGLERKRAGLIGRRDAAKRVIESATSVRGGIVVDLLETEQQIAELTHTIEAMKK